MKPLTRMFFRASAMLFAAFAAVTTANAQTVLPQPDLGLVDNGSVTNIVRQPDGGVVFCGTFSSVNGMPRQNIARLLPGGALDPEWNPGLDSYVCALAVDADGDVYVGGTFTLIGGIYRPFLAKLAGNGTGALIEDWQPDAITGAVTTLEIAGNDLFAEGEFFYFDGTPLLEGLAKMSTATGALDPDWRVPLPPDGRVMSLKVVDTSLYVGGQFTSIGGKPRNGLAKVDRGGTGAVDDSWDPAPNFASVWALLPDGAGNLYVGGYFSQIAGVSRQGLARFSLATGALDASWNPGGTFGIRFNVTSLAVDGDQLYAGGSFYSTLGAPLNKIARITTTGSGALNWNWAAIKSGEVSVLARDGATLLVGGNFERANDETSLSLVRLGPDGALSGTQAGAEIPGRVLAIARQHDGSTIVGGAFDKAGGSPRRNLLRLLPDGTLDPGWKADFTGAVRALAIGPADVIYVGSASGSIVGPYAGSLVRLLADGTFDVDWLPQTNGSPQGIAIDAAGNVYAGSMRAQGSAWRLLSKYDSTGQAAPDWNPTVDGDVLDIALDGMGSLYVVGEFSTINGWTRRGIARLSTVDGTVDPAWNPGSFGTVRAIALHGGSIYVGGSFSMIGGEPRHNLAKLPSTGTGIPDPAWQPETTETYSYINALAVDGNGAVYAGGNLSTPAPQPRFNLVRFSGTDGSTDPSWSADTDLDVDAITLDGSTLLVGGAFTSVAGKPRQGLARLSNDRIFSDGFEDR